MVQKGRREFPLISDHFLLSPVLLASFVYSSLGLLHFQFFTNSQQKKQSISFIALCVTDERCWSVSDAKISMLAS